jgi:deazaflavin-dependent oxidoreductase (nitroreductase family)
MSSSTQRPPQAASASSHVPERRNPLVLSKGGGRILSAAMLPAFLAWPPRGWGVLTTTGRKSGKQRRKCVRAVREGDEVYIISIKPSRASETAAWVLNIRANPRVSLRIKGGTFTGVARELTDGQERGRVKPIYCERINPFDYVSCTLHRSGLPTLAKIKALHASWFDKGIPLAVTLDA